MELLANALLQDGKYIILKTLGQGGFGITYLAEQTNLGRKVCIKEFFMKEYGERTAAPAADSDATVMADDSTVLSGNVAATGPKSSPENDATVLTGVSGITSTAAAIMERYKEKFLKEARTIAKLDHPGIVRIHDVFEENGTAYYVMDFIEGENLNDKVKREGPLSEETALGYIRQVADALSFVHGHNIMHLDVKPANILVRKSDDKAILIDFGAAKQYDSDGSQTSTTPVGLSAGYAPIEMTKPGGVQTFSPETDVYSLGATLYYLVTGQNPPDASERMEMIMDGEKFQLPDSISSSTSEVIERSMQARKKRIQNVNGFMELLNSDGEKRRLEAEEKAAKEAEAKRQEALRIEREKEEAEKKRIAKEKARAEAEAKRQEALRKEQEKAKAEAEKKRIAEKDARNKDTMRWVLIALAAAVGVLILIPIINNSSYSNSNYSGDGPAEMNAAESLGYQGSENGHAWVDLGLSVKWATCNIGASSPNQYGEYYAFGETSYKNNYSWNTLKYYSGAYLVNPPDQYNHSFSKYESSSSLEMMDDAAHINWGGRWRIPSAMEIKELKDNCTYVWTSQGGTNGWRVKSKINGQSIFLPAAGIKEGSNVTRVGESGTYWSRDCFGPNVTTLYFGSNCFWANGGTARYFGCSVRPVMD